MIRSRVRARGGIIQWFLSNAYKADSVSPSLILDFANNRYAANSSAKNFSDILTFTRGSTGTYFDSSGVMQTSAADVPRFDCDPATGVANGLLIEGARTNLIFNSSYPYTTWVSVSATITAAPATFLGHFTDGATVASQGATWNRIQTNNAISWTAGTTYAWTAFVKGGTSGNVRFVFRNESLANESNVSGVIGGLLPSYSSTAGTVTVNTPTPVQGGYIYSGTFVPAVNSSNARLACGPYSTVAGETVHIYGFQFEAGAFPSSYIPTISAAVTRAADIVTNSASNTVKFADWYNQSEGTVVASHSPVISNGVISQIDDTTNDNRFLLNALPDGAQQFVAVGGGTLVSSFTTGISSGYYKTAGAYKLNDFALSTNASAVVTDTAGTIPSVSRMTIGSRTGGMHLFGTIKELLFYQIRVTNSEMQRITNA